MRIRPTTARLVAAGAGAVLVLGLAACSSDSSSDGAAASATGSASAPASPTAVSAVFDRVAQATGDAKSVRGTLTTSSTDGELSGDFAYQFTPSGVKAAFSFDQEGKTFSGILTDTTIYIGGEGLPLPAGKKYLKVDLNDASGLGKSYASLAENFTQAADIDASIDQWRGLADLREAGTETVNGVQATKYVGSVNPAAPPADASAEVKQAYAALAKAGVTKVETTIWIGPDGLPVQVKAVSDGDVASTTVVTYEDWGAGVTVDVPAASKVADLSSLLGG